MESDVNNVRRLVAAMQEAMSTETTREGTNYSANDIISAYLTASRAACVAIRDFGGSEAVIIDALRGIILDVSTPKGQVS